LQYGIVLRQRFCDTFCHLLASGGLFVGTTLTGMAAIAPTTPTASAASGWLATAQAQRAAGHRMQALALCEQRLQQQPGDQAALRLQVQLLSELGAAGRALELARQLDPPLDDVQLAALEAAMAAHQTRWSRAEPADPRQPYVEADRAVTTQDDILAVYGTRVPQVAAQVDVDRMISYNQASRNTEAVRDYRDLLAQGKQLPPYAEASLADALLERHQPEQAIPLYEDSIKREPPPYAPDAIDPRLGLAYAYFEAGRYADAIRLIDHVADSEPAWIKRNGRLPDSNSHKLDAALNAALLREYRWLLQEAWDRISTLLAQAPMNEVLWRELGNLQRSRGWPRAAEDSMVTSAGIDDSDLHTRLGLIASWRELDDFARVEPALQQVEAVNTRDSEVAKSRDEWDRQRGWQFDLEHDRGSGDSPNYGDRDHETQATLMSPLLADHWRVYGITRLAGASLPEGGVERDRLGFGVRGYMRDLEGYLQILPGVGPDTLRTAVEAGLKWFPNDHWTFSADWSSTGDQDVPLRANYYGITAHALDVSAQWRASELTSVQLTAAHDRFTDGNRRNGWQANFLQRLHTAPYLTLDGGVELGQSSNSKSDAVVPYYSPSRARWGMLTGRLENVLSQRYERSWKERIDIAAGTYQERNYGSGWAASASYGQTFQPHGGLVFGWTLGWNSQPYDGKRDHRVTLDLTMHWGE